MKTHIEYDDFGEFIETLEEVREEGPAFTGAGPVRKSSLQDPHRTGAWSLLRKTLRNFLLTLAAAAVMFTTTSFAALL